MQVHRSAAYVFVYRFVNHGKHCSCQSDMRPRTALTFGFLHGWDRMHVLLLCIPFNSTTCPVLLLCRPTPAIPVFDNNQLSNHAAPSPPDPASCHNFVTALGSIPRAYAGVILGLSLLIMEPPISRVFEVVFSGVF